MQLTAKLALLAALTYSAPRALALPIAGIAESIIARNAQYDIDARDFADFQVDARAVDDLEFTARELIDRYHEAREYFDELDARSLEDLDIDAREFEDFLFARTTNKDLSTQILADLTAIIANADLKSHAAQDPDLKEVLQWLDVEVKDKNFWKTFHPGQKSGSDQGDSDEPVAWKQARKTRLDTIKAFKQGGDFSKVKTAVSQEKTELAWRHQPYNKDGLTVDPKLSAVLTHPGAQQMFNSFALAKNEVLALLQKISVDTKNTYHEKAREELANKKAHNDLLKKQDAGAKAKSDAWNKDLADIQAGKDPKNLVKDARDHVHRLRTILSNQATSPAYKKAVTDEDNYRAKQQASDKTATPAAGGPAGAGAVQQPITGGFSGGSKPQGTLRRRRTKY